MICRHGGLTFIRHNELRDLTAESEWLQEVCHDVTVEPPLLPLNGELITPSSANCSNTARADIHARGFWGRQQGALFDIRVFHPNAPSYHQTRVASIFRRHELEKKREYGDRIRSVDCGSFTPLVFQLLVVWARRLLFSTTVWQIFYHRSTLRLTTRHSPGCAVLYHFPYYVRCTGHSWEQKAAVNRAPRLFLLSCA